MEDDFLEKIRNIKRGPAITLQKDIGLILTNTNINRNSLVVDAGTGSGYLASFLARYVKKVVSYEVNKEFYKIAKKNFEYLKIKNITLKNKDITNGINERNVDLITLDLSTPWLVLKEAKKALKANGYLAAYLPNITQVTKIVESLGRDFKLIKVSEVIEREWHIEGRRVRPKNIIIGHSAFLVFIKKV